MSLSVQLVGEGEASIGYSVTVSRRNNRPMPRVRVVTVLSVTPVIPLGPFRRGLGKYTVYIGFSAANAVGRLCIQRMGGVVGVRGHVAAAARLKVPGLRPGGWIERLWKSNLAVDRFEIERVADFGL